MRNFIRNIKEHKIAALICLALLAAVIVIAVFLLKPAKGGNNTSSDEVSQEQPQPYDEPKTEVYFSYSNSPVSVTIAEGKMTVELDGSATPDLKWDMVCSPEGVAAITTDGEKEGGKLTALISPMKTGYVKASFTRKGSAAGLDYEAVAVEMDLIVAADENNVMYVKLSDIRQNIASSGALDTSSPYLLSGSRVIFPQGGDWTLTVSASSEAAKDMYVIRPGVDDKGYSFYEVKKDLSKLINEKGEIDQAAYDSKLLLKSESLGIEKKLECVIGSDNESLLREAEK